MRLDKEIWLMSTCGKNNAQPIRTGLIGYGSWTRKAYVPALTRDARAVIVAAAAPSERTRNRIAGDLGPDVAVYDGFEGLLNGPALDAVMIAVPDFMHEAALSAVIDAGVPVLYEPPVSDTRQGIPTHAQASVESPSGYPC